MNEEFEQLIAQGEAILEEKERNEAIKRIAAEEQTRLARLEMKALFMVGLSGLLPAAVMEELGPIDEEKIWSGWPELRLQVDGCPIVFEVVHRKGEEVHFNSKQPFMVPGIESSEPYFYDDEIFEGGAAYSFANRASSSCGNLVEALGLARKTARRLVEVQIHNEELLARLKEKVIAERQARPVLEPVYVPDDDPVSIQCGSLFNMDEFYHYVRGVACEVLEERQM